MATGLRVIRGRDWLSGDVDGGEGHLGTVVSYGKDETAEVIWDNGKQTVSSIGKDGKYELRLVDNAPVGVCHQTVTCGGCGEIGVIGIQWSCGQCTSFHLCSLCYVTGKHDLSHNFVRHDKPTSTGERVPARDTSKKIRTRGLFPGAVVTRGTHWDQGDNDGGPGKEGTVVVIQSFDSTSHRSVVNIAWDSGETTMCRVGHKGQVDIHCVREALGPDIYAEHLPLLDTANAVAPIHLKPLAEGGSLQEDRANSGKDEESGKESKKGGSEGSSHKAKVPKPKAGSVVRILDDKAKVKDLQEGHGGWNDTMEKALGKVGKVLIIHPTGDVLVRFGLNMWTFNPVCCLPASESELPSDTDVLGLEDLLSPDDFLKNMRQQLAAGIGLPDGLLQTEIKIHTASLKGEGAKEFLEAIKDSDVEKVKKVFEKFPKLANGPIENGITCLHIAANEGKLEIVKFLMEKEFDKNAKDALGSTPLLNALDSKHIDVARFLIEAGTDLDICNDSGQTAIHCAVGAGEASIVRDLIMRGCDVNVMDNSGDTALHDAIAQHETSCAEMILTSPILDLTIENEKGFNPLHWAAFHGKSSSTLVEKILQRNKSLVNVRMEDGPTPLHIAAINDHTETAQILIKQGADVNVKDKNKEASPLHLACIHAYLGAAKILVAAGKY
ncbi:E3 ubiquitin-protein ligase MIB2-like [Gigantopelta aegis]|uniref:E3 ubiquitin-protein ligase MIB2-like n=1 Tax=Gigantopelta aegis TaxID=1735272 RepID=UPI001B889D51|nr:E3 ubiquitin-protein ligase MIB2-like [Gigantopelta aegis]